ncbi:MAG TPA: hypothetical protein VJT84_15035 [Gaiellaceae bacterium]|nr:hypothetical protein [Gaiellaceae bacterium]
MTERELQALAAHIDFPAERDLAPAVRARLAPRRGRRRALVVVLAAVAVAIGVAFAVPPARSAILRFFHIQGVTVEVVDKLPQVKTTGALDLGPPIDLEHAALTTRFQPLRSNVLGDPDRVTWDGRQLWFVYGNVRLLISQFVGFGFERFIKKVIEPQTRIQAVTVDGEPALFISGARHFVYMESTDLIREERIRLARNVLLWEHGRLTLRLEGDLTLGEALRIARSFR